MQGHLPSIAFSSLFTLCHCSRLCRWWSSSSGSAQILIDSPGWFVCCCDERTDNRWCLERGCRGTVHRLKSRHTMAEVEVAVAPTIGELPEAIAISIASLLSLREISSLAQTCTSWHAACSSNDLWRALYLKRWPDCPLLSLASIGSPLIPEQHDLLPLESSGFGEMRCSGSNVNNVPGAYVWRARLKSRIAQVTADEKALAALLDNFPTFGGRTSRSIEVCKICCYDESFST